MNIQRLSFTTNGYEPSSNSEAVYVVTVNGVAHYIQMKRVRNDPYGNQTGNFYDQTSASVLNLGEFTKSNIDEDTRFIIDQLLEEKDGVKKNKIIYDHSTNQVIRVE